MYRLKGFMGIEPLVLNTSGVIAPIGELSTYSLTYAKDVGEYNSNTFSKYTLYSFVSALADGSKVAAPQTIQDQVFSVTDWAYQKQILSSASTTRAAFLADLTTQYASTATLIDCGNMVQATGGLLFPEWISYKQSGLATNDPAYDNTVTIWYSDSVFAQQYDEFLILVVPPLANIDVFFSPKATVVAALGAVTLSQNLAAIQTAKSRYPETVVSGENFDYVDPISLTRTPTNWSLVIYGLAGNDIDAIRDSIRTYIAANSTHTELEWRAIFPDIYKNTEFLVFPRWKNFAIPDRDLQQGTYSPNVNLAKEVAYLKTQLPGYLASYVDAHASVIPCNYKSLALLLIGSPDNRGNLFDITTLYPDIINVPTADALFQSMGPSTQAWILGLQNMILAAETSLTYSQLPSGLRKTIRNGIVYITAKFNNVNFLVATKASTPNYS
jgi:hypothetical protein